MQKYARGIGKKYMSVFLASSGSAAVEYSPRNREVEGSIPTLAVFFNSFFPSFLTFPS